MVTPDLSTIDALARLQLAAHRFGFEVRLRRVSQELQELITFAGLDDVLSVEPRGQTEEREQRFRIEEEREIHDPST